MNPTFTQLNNGWNAEPNAPDPQAAWKGDSLVLRFRMNAFQFPEYDEDDIGELVFEDCTRYRIGTVNDEGWYRDQGRFGRRGHRWGEFYEIAGGLSPVITPDDWIVRCQDDEAGRHYLFYFRDEDFECVARSWTLKITKKPNKPWMATPTSPSVLDAPTLFQPSPRDQRWLPLVGLPSL